MEDIFAFLGLIVFMTWIISRLRTRRKFVPVLGIIAGVWFIWLFSILDIEAYFNGENVNLFLTAAKFLLGVMLLLKNLKDLRKSV